MLVKGAHGNKVNQHKPLSVVDRVKLHTILVFCCPVKLIWIEQTIKIFLVLSILCVMVEWQRENNKGTRLTSVFIHANSVVNLCHLIYLRSMKFKSRHYDDAKMGSIGSQITSLTIVYSAVYSGEDKRKHQSSASLAFVWEIHRWPVNCPHKWPVTRKTFPLMTSSCSIPTGINKRFLSYINLQDDAMSRTRVPLQRSEWSSSMAFFGQETRGSTSTHWNNDRPPHR